MSDALTALYGEGDDAPKKGRGGLGGSAPRVAKWLGDIREFFPAPVVQVIQKDAFERKGLRQMLLEPEFLATVEADVNLIADLVSLRGVMPEKTKETARDRDRQGGRRADGAAGAAHRRRDPRRARTARAAPTGRALPISTGRAPSAPICATTRRSIAPSCRSG